jgi:DNA polymerase I
MHAYLMDASLYVFRAYHSLSPDWHDREGWPTHAVHGFTNTLLTLLERVKPTTIAICFDEAFDCGYRNELYPAYKANREAPTDELVRQFQYCKRVASALGLLVLANPRYEADDLIGSLTHALQPVADKTTILSVDKDLGQLLHARAEQWDFTKGVAFGPQGVMDKFGVPPEQLAELQALTGDAVDNIPGIEGIGPKTAAALLQHFGSLKALLQRLEELPFLRMRGAGACYGKLKGKSEAIALALQLTTIARDAPVPELSALAIDLSRGEPVDLLFNELGFGTFLRNRAKAWRKRCEQAIA